MSKVLVRILKHVGSYTPGQVLEVTDVEAKYLCEAKCRSDGAGLIKWQNAIVEAEFQKIKAAPVDHGGLTLDEAKALGIRNVVQTPPDEILPARLRAAEKPNQAGFEEHKDATEGSSALQSEELNAKNPNNKKKASA